MLYDGVEVQSIKLAVSGIESLNISSKQVLLSSIVYLGDNYKRLYDQGYLKKALWHIYAYLELGFPYEDGKNIFESIFQELKLTQKEVFLGKYTLKKTALNRSSIRKILGKWNPKLHSMKVNEAVEDIMENISNKRRGVYVYHSGRVLIEDKMNILWEKTFKLYVQEEVVFHDVNKNKYYVF